jgi:1-acyl-sn-glycerol-3-phosphate acyltransferase
MRALRSLVWVVFSTAIVIPWALGVLLVSAVASSATTYRGCQTWVRICLWGARVFCGLKPELRGLENLPKGENDAVILLPKHQSTLETFALCAYMPRPLAFVFKRELLFLPFFGWAMARMDMIHIDRRKRTQAFAKVTEQGQRLAAKGVWVIMFPEGTRIPRGQAGDYRLGGTRLATSTGVPVVPVACATAKLWPKGSLLLKPGTYVISIGPPIPSQGRDPEELMAEVKAWIEAEMRRLDPEAYLDAHHPDARSGSPADLRPEHPRSEQRGSSNNSNNNASVNA